jgi:hypothetical protein
MLRHTLLGIGITLVIMALLLSLDLNLFNLNSPKETVMTEEEIIKEARKLGMSFPAESYSNQDIKLKKNYDLEGAFASVKEDNIDKEIKGEELVDQSLLIQDNNIVREEKLKSEKADIISEVGVSQTKDNNNSKEAIDLKAEDEIETAIEDAVEKVQADSDDVKKKLREELTRELKEQLKKELKKEIKEELERENKKVLLTIPKGISSREVSTLLLYQGVIEDKDEFIAMVDELNLETKIKAGTYSFQLPISVKEVLLQVTSNN